MKIRPADFSDAEGIRKILFDSNISRHSPADQQGLVEYPVPKIREIRDRIARSDIFYVLDSGNEVVGMSANYPSRALASSSFTNDEIARHATSSSSKFAYFDVLAVRKNLQGQGFGVRLLKTAIEAASQLGYGIALAPIAHFPHRNELSIRIAKNEGFALKEEIRTSNDLTFGLYSRTLDLS